MDQFVHCSTKFPWLIIALAILQGPGSVCINSYQAEGGYCPKTFCLGMVLNMLAGILSWTLLVPIAVYGFGIYHGYLVMNKSK